MKLALEFGGEPAQLRHPLPDRAQHARQLLRPNRDQRDRANDEKLAPTNVEHGDSNSAGSGDATGTALPLTRVRAATGVQPALRGSVCGWTEAGLAPAAW